MLFLCCANLGIWVKLSEISNARTCKYHKRLQSGKVHGHNCCMVCPKVSFGCGESNLQHNRPGENATQGIPTAALIFPNYLSWQSEICEKDLLRTYWLPCEGLEPLEVLSGGITKVLGRGHHSPLLQHGLVQATNLRNLQWTSPGIRRPWVVRHAPLATKSAAVAMLAGYQVCDAAICCIHPQKAKSIVELV